MFPERTLKAMERYYEHFKAWTCPWCDGVYRNDEPGFRRCVSCGRTDDVLREVKVYREQRKPHHNWKGKIYGKRVMNGLQFAGGSLEDSAIRPHKHNGVWR
jgi:hypothetical protein